MPEFSIRSSVPADHQAIANFYPLAFPDEDLLPLLSLLLMKTDQVSLVAEKAGVVVGHVVFTPCSLASSSIKLGLLGPLAVHPAHQKQGIGGALIDEGMAQLKADDYCGVLVLGDPNYYGRSGFKAERKIAPPYPLPKEWDGAWQSIPLLPTDDALRGTLVVPDPWRDPLWWAG